MDPSPSNYNDSHLLDFDRAGKITASLVAAIMGIDPYITRQEAWRRIKGTAKRKPANPFQQWGVDHEANALMEFEVQAGILLRPGQFVPHPQIPWLGASPDGFTPRGEPVEVKCPMKIHEEMPAHYRLQVLTQIECCGASNGFFASWTEVDFHWWPVAAEKQYWWDEVYKELYYFYYEYVVKDVEPPRRRKTA